MGKTLALASTTSRANVDIYMHQNEHIRAQMDFSALFSCIFTRDDVDEIKPSPKMHHLVMQTLGVSPKDCLVVEDSLAGVLAAEAAGIAVWAVYDRFAQKDQAAICARADHYFASCTAMLDFVKGAQTSPPTLDNNQSE